MLTTAQLQILHTWLVANAQAMNDAQAAAALNGPASTDTWCWRTTVGRHEVTDRPSLDTNGTTPTAFVWGGATGGYINRSQGERDAWRELFNATDLCQPSLANVRTAFADIFSGAGAGAQANRAHLWGISQRLMSLGEQLLAVPTVGGPTQTGNRGTKTNPDTLGYEGPFVPDDITNAYNS